MRYTNFEALDIERKRALSNRDSLRYFELCNTLGVPQNGIEDLHLYEIGEAESQFSREMLVSARRRVNDKYRDFLEQSDGVSSGLGESSERKRNLLLTHFPNRFGNGKGQDLVRRGYNSAQIGTLFKKMVEYARKKVSEDEQ